MARLSNDAEGQASGSAVALAQGGSGDPFTVIDVTTGTGTLTYSNTVAMHGYQSYAMTAAAAGGRLVGWNGQNDASCAVRCYIYLNANPASTGNIVTIRPSSGASAVLQISATRQLIITNFAGAGIKTFATVLSLSTWYRLELQTTKGTGTGDGYIAAQYYLGDSLTAIDTFSSNAVNAGTTNNTGVRFGKMTTATATFDGYFDDLVYVGGTVQPVGPSVPGLILNNYQAVKVGDGVSVSERIR